MEELLGPSGALTLWVQQWGYAAVFIGIMLENAGIPVPGETIIIIASVMAGQKMLRVELVYLAVVMGAIIGDNIGYWIGLRGGRPLLLKLARLGHVSDAKLDETEAYFLQHSKWAVFGGRFVALLRIFAGPLAGMIRMPWPTFFACNAAGAVVWCGMVVGLAYKFGEHIETILHNLGLALLVLFLIAVAYVGVRVWRKPPAAIVAWRGRGTKPLPTVEGDTGPLAESPFEGSIEIPAAELPAANSVDVVDGPR